MTVTEIRQNDQQLYRKFRFPFTNCLVTLLSWIFPFVAVSPARPQKRTDIARKGEKTQQERKYRARLWVGASCESSLCPQHRTASERTEWLPCWALIWLCSGSSFIGPSSSPLGWKCLPCGIYCIWVFYFYSKEFASSLRADIELGHFRDVVN